MPKRPSNNNNDMEELFRREAIKRSRYMANNPAMMKIIRDTTKTKKL